LFFTKKIGIIYHTIYKEDFGKTLKPDYNYIELCIVGNYKEEIDNKSRLKQWIKGDYKIGR
jgi:hypothetical protein